MTDPASKSRSRSIAQPADLPPLRIALTGTRSTPPGLPAESFEPGGLHRIREMAPELNCKACPDQKTDSDLNYRLVLRCTSVVDDH